MLPYTCSLRNIELQSRTIFPSQTHTHRQIIHVPGTRQVALEGAQLIVACTAFFTEA